MRSCSTAPPASSRKLCSCTQRVNGPAHGLVDEALSGVAVAVAGGPGPGERAEPEAQVGLGAVFEGGRGACTTDRRDHAGHEAS
jgi:hypothetical protein